MEKCECGRLKGNPCGPLRPNTINVTMPVKDTFTSPVARKTHLVWNPLRPNEPVLWESKVELGWDFFQEIIRCPVPLDMNILKALSRSSLGLDL